MSVTPLRLHARAGHASGTARQGTPFVPRRVIVERLQGPMRVAIAGRVKAGKSTLLNALVGERLAPTDAGECTRLISWYRHGIGYRVAATLPSGEQRGCRSAATAAPSTSSWATSPSGRSAGSTCSGQRRR